MHISVALAWHNGGIKNNQSGSETGRLQSKTLATAAFPCSGEQGVHSGVPAGICLVLAKKCCSHVLLVSGGSCSRVPVRSCAAASSVFCFVSLPHTPHLSCGRGGLCLPSGSLEVFDHILSLHLNLARAAARSYPAACKCKWLYFHETLVFWFSFLFWWPSAAQTTWSPLHFQTMMPVIISPWFYWKLTVFVRLDYVRMWRPVEKSVSPWNIIWGDRNFLDKKIHLVTCIPINWCADVLKLPEISKRLLYLTLFTIFLQTGSPTFINIYKNCPEESKIAGMYSFPSHAYAELTTADCLGELLLGFCYSGEVGSAQWTTCSSLDEGQTETPYSFSKGHLPIFRAAGRLIRGACHDTVQ